MKQPLLKRFAQESTWRGIVAVLIAVGITLTPEQQEAILAAGISLIGLINILKPD